MAIIDSIILSSEQDPQVGYIFALSSKHSSYGYLVSAANKVNNLKYTSWAPQKELFSNDKVKLFITHCGANSVIEANYFGVKPLGSPITDEQYSVMTRLKNMGLSKQIKLTDDSQTILKLV